MENKDDAELLRDYTVHGSEAAFALLVTRHVDLVYASAMRQVGNPSLAEEVTQAVFVILAQKAKQLSPDTVLPGWLCTTARLTASTELRRIRRQRHYEELAQIEMKAHVPSQAESHWEEVAPLLDHALSRLGESDRNAVVLRFLKGLPLQEVGKELRIDPGTAQKRVARALEKLRRFFLRRGLSISTSVLALHLTQISLQAAPVHISAGLASKVLLADTLSSEPLGGLVGEVVRWMGWLKVKAFTQLVIVVSSTIGVGVAVVSTLSEPADPVYQGKPISQWVNELRVSPPPQRRLEPTNGSWAAILSVGSPSLPYLVKNMRLPENQGERRELAELRAKQANAPDALGEANVDALERRRAAFWALGAIGPFAKPALPDLLKGLTDPDSGVRWLAAEALANISDSSTEVVRALARTLQDSESFVRLQAISTLTQLGTNSVHALPEVIELLDDLDSGPMAASCLGEMGSAAAPAIDRLLEFIPPKASTNGLISGKHQLIRQWDSDGEMRASSAFALGRIGLASPPVLEALQDALDNRLSRVRLRAVQALGRLGASAEVARPRVRGALLDPELDVRREAAVALWRMGGRELEDREALDLALKRVSEQLSLTTVTNDFERFGAGELRSTLSKVLLMMSPSRTELFEHLSSSGLMDQEFLKWIGTHGDSAKSLVPLLVLKLEEQHQESVPYGLLNLLGMVDPTHPLFADRIHALLTHTNVHIRSGAAYLGWSYLDRRVWSEPAVSLLTQCIAEAGSLPCSGPAHSLEQMGTDARSAAQVLQNSLWHPDPYTRFHMASALERVAPDVYEVVLRRIWSGIYP
jgi:RNA polymerase sigma factor (sigma-70 family)